MAMLMTRRDPFADFDALIRRAFPAPRTESGPVIDFRPAAEITRDGDDALVKLELPGVDVDKDVTVELDRGALVIRGERRDETVAQDDAEAPTRVLREIRYGSFRRSFTLPEHVTADALSASYDAGVITVRVAGVYATSEPQKVTVAVGAAKGVETVDAATVDAV